VKHPVRFREPASAELTEAVRWYETRRAGLGAEFFDAIAATVALFESNVEVDAIVSRDGHTRRALVGRFPYQAVCPLRPTQIVIVAVAHLRRRPGYWKHRS
jgi:hypothetical protein